MHFKWFDSAALVWGISNVSILKVVAVDVVSDLKCFDFAALVWGISNVSILKCIVHFKCVDSAALVWGIVVLKHGWATVRNFKNIYRLFDRRSPNVSEAHPDQPRRTSRLQAKTGHSPYSCTMQLDVHEAQATSVSLTLIPVGFRQAEACLVLAKTNKLPTGPSVACPCYVIDVRNCPKNQHKNAGCKTERATSPKHNKSKRFQINNAKQMGEKILRIRSTKSRSESK